MFRHRLGRPSHLARYYVVYTKVTLPTATVGRRCFRLEEEWTADSLSSRDDGVMRNVARVHVLRTGKTVEGESLSIP